MAKELEQGEPQKKLHVFEDAEQQEEVDEIEQLRQKKAAKLKRQADALEAIRAKVRECAGRVMLPADPDALIFEMHWGFPPLPRSPG